MLVHLLQCNAYGGSEALAGSVLVRLLRDLLVRLPRPLEAELAGAYSSSGAGSGGGGGRRSVVGRAAAGGKGAAKGAMAEVGTDEMIVILCEDFLAFQTVSMPGCEDVDSYCKGRALGTTRWFVWMDASLLQATRLPYLCCAHLRVRHSSAVVSTQQRVQSIPIHLHSPPPLNVLCL